MRGIKKTVAISISVLVLAAGAASAKTVPGSDAGEVLRGSRNADTIHGYGGADLIYTYGGRDTVWGGNESGKVKVVAENPPAGLFGHTGKVLIEHEGESLLVPEDEVEDHVGHGDEMLDPTGRSGAGPERR